MLNRKEVHNSETLNIQIDSHDQKSYLIELSKDCTKFDLNVECLENSFSRKKPIEMESLCGSKRAGG